MRRLSRGEDKKERKTQQACEDGSVETGGSGNNGDRQQWKRRGYAATEMSGIGGNGKGGDTQRRRKGRRPAQKRGPPLYP